MDSNERLVVSSIYIEPINRLEYNKNLAEKLTCYHKQKFLQFVRTERSFLHATETNSKLPDYLVNDLNQEKLRLTEKEWIKLFKAWICLVSETSTQNVLFTEDLILWRYIFSNASKNHNTETLKPNLLDKFATHCRICLASSSTKMLSLFEEKQRAENMSLVEKLNYCSCFVSHAHPDDNLPKNICMSCSILVENAYQLKVICAKTEERFEELMQNHNRKSGEDTTKKVQAKFRVNNSESESRRETYFLHEDEIMNMEIEIVENEMTNNESQEAKDETNQIPGATYTRKYTRKSDPSPQEYQCDICKTVIHSRRGLLNHMTNKHMGDRGRNMRYSCPECQKHFREKTALTVHLRCHTGERPYACELCGKAFKTMSACSSHRVVHTEAKDFKCPNCEFSTNTKANLNLHERTHSGVLPYTCKFCPMKFRTASNVVKHTRNIHEKQKTNKCDKCDRSFFSKESLRKHSISHTGLKPFTCPNKECSVSYVWYNGLKKHIRLQHRNGGMKLPTEKFFFDQIKNILPS